MKSIQSRGKGRGRQNQRRRGAVAAQTAICLTTLVGFTALTVDVGHMYDVRGELQRTVDAAALASAAELGDWGNGSPKDAARGVAVDYAARNLVNGSGLTLNTAANGDVIFGRAHIDDGTGRYVFTPDNTEQYPNAVHVRGSTVCPLYFAAIFGKSSTTISARATAVLTPRDIAFVLDLSTSHNDDSQLRSFRNVEINNREVYDSLADVDAALTPQTDSLGFESGVSLVDNGDGTTTVTIALTSVSATKALSHVTFGLPSEVQGSVAASAWTDGDYEAPVWGTDPTTGMSGLKFDAIGDGLGEDGAVETDVFSFSIPNEYLSQVTLGVATKAGTGVDTSVSYQLEPEVRIGNLRDWGTEVTDPSWDFANDDGMVRLARYENWSQTAAWTSQTINERGYGTYTAAELAAINSSAYDSDTDYYRRRVLVAMGVYRWKSGLTGGQPGGNGNDYIGSGEVEMMISYPSSSVNPDTLCKDVGGSWYGFVDYVRNSSSRMCQYSPGAQLYGDPGLQYRYGLKTFVDYLLENAWGDSTSPGLAGTPQQPMSAVAGAVKESMNIIHGLQGGDLVGLASYGTEGYGPAERPSNMSWLTWVNTTAEKESLQGLIDQLQPGMWTSNTNIAQGIDKGVDVLFNSSNARPNAAKVLLLLTDGIANQVRQNPTYWNESEARSDALEAAADARNQGVRIYTISVGANADQDLMKQIADPTYNPADPHEVAKHFHAEGAIADYQAQLQDIFRKLGGDRPVVLIE